MRALIALLLLASAAPAFAEAQRIGAAGAVSGGVKALSAGDAVGRIVESGKPIFLNDHVITDGKGRLQVMLLDETVFTIGPNSDMVLDEFVYDPATSTGKVSAQVAKGVFRFVTGKVARKDPASMKVKLAVGTIGIRGTIAAGRTDETGSTVVLLGPGAGNNSNEPPGAISVDNGGTQVLIDQPGFGTSFTPQQQTLSVSDMSDQAMQIVGEMVPAEGSSGDGGGQDGSSGSGSSGSSDGSSEAGQTTAAGGEILLQSAGASEVAQAFDDSASRAVQDIALADAGSAILDGISTWDQVRRTETGTAYYSGDGTFLFSGPFWSGTGDMHLAFEVDFGGRTYGGSGSYLSLENSQMEFSDSTDIGQSSFDSLTGPATITLVSPVNSTNPNFDNTTISFVNQGGVAAQSLDVNLVFSDPNPQYGGTAVGQMTAVQSEPPSLPPSQGLLPS